MHMKIDPHLVARGERLEERRHRRLEGDALGRHARWGDAVDVRGGDRIALRM